MERTHHGDTVVDHYDWLRDKTSEQVLDHLRAENTYTAAKTAHLEDLREQIFGEISERTQQTDLSVPARRGDWWYYSRTVEGKQYASFCRCPAVGEDWTPPVVDPSAPSPGEEVMLDANALAEGKPFFSLGAASVSDDGRRLAYSTDVVGDERFTLRVRDLETGEDLPDEVPGISYGAIFSADAGHVFYTMVDDAWRPFEVRRHRVGSPLAEDVVVAREDDERFWLSLDLSTDRRYLLVQRGSKTTSEVSVLDLAEPTGEPQLVAPRRDGVEYEVDHVPGWDGRWVVVHNDGAPNFALALTTLGGEWEPLGVVSEDERLLSATALSRGLVLEARRDGLPVVLVAPYGEVAGSLGETWQVQFDGIELPNPGVGQVLDVDAPLLRVGVTSFATPASVYDVDLRSREAVLRKQTAVLGGVDLSEYVEERTWARADDGAGIPVSVFHRRDQQAGGGHPTLLYGYGSYETSIDPAFSVPRLSLLDRGVVFAVAHIRGGGEMGRSWYDQGKLMEKKNTFSDFVAARDHLVDTGWADPDRIVAMGGSAGGLLVGAAANLAPDKFTGVMAQVPFVDVLTSILDPSLPLTVIEWEEWGNPLHDPEAYAYIKSYSPVDNVAPVRFPKLLATTSLHDTRVLYVEPAKWVSTIRHVLGEAGLPGGDDVLLRIEMDGGHGGASGRYETWKERAYEMAWNLDVLGLA